MKWNVGLYQTALNGLNPKISMFCMTVEACKFLLDGFKLH